MQNGTSHLQCNDCCAADNIPNSISMVNCPRRQGGARRTRSKWKPWLSRQTWAARYVTRAGKAKNIALTFPFAVGDAPPSPKQSNTNVFNLYFPSTLPYS